MKIYTKTGDKGTTGLVGGTRVKKDDPRICAIGAIDELNAILGWCRHLAHGRPIEIEIEIEWIQSRLFDIGAELATPQGSMNAPASVDAGCEKRLEDRIDGHTAELPALRNFILPGGGELASALHLARVTCRRAEREIVSFAQIEPIRNEIVVFLNRLSDWLFVEARVANRDDGLSDIIWSREPR